MGGKPSGGGSTPYIPPAPAPAPKPAEKPKKINRGNEGPGNILAGGQLGNDNAQEAKKTTLG